MLWLSVPVRELKKTAAQLPECAGKLEFPHCTIGRVLPPAFHPWKSPVSKPPLVIRLARTAGGTEKRSIAVAIHDVTG